MPAKLPIILAFSLFFCFFPLGGCIPASAQKQDVQEIKISMALQDARLPADLARRVLEQYKRQPDQFVKTVNHIIAQDPYLWRLVDKSYGLDAVYEPDDLISLKSGNYLLNRSGLQLRRVAAEALEVMAKAAKVDGVTLLVSSCYRSYGYQKQVYQRNVQQMGQAAADRESARPGHSQHQLGLAVDFGSIDDSFAQTKQSRWLEKNAVRYGWSLSYPQGMEQVTGYRWESWHYRYVGPELSKFIDTYFDGVQQYALAFLHGYTR